MAALAVLGGVGLRVAVLTSHLRVLDSDEAVVGLIARDALDGRFTAFFWYQAYGGVLEALLAAPLVLVQPTTVIGLKLVPVVLTGVAAVALWRLATRALAAGPALLAGALAWCWCGAFVWWSTKARGLRRPAGVLGGAGPRRRAHRGAAP